MSLDLTKKNLTQKYNIPEDPMLQVVDVPKEHVNRLLEDAKYDYIFTENGEKKILEKNHKAMEIDVVHFTTTDGQTVSRPLSEKLKHTPHSDKIEIGDDVYEVDTLAGNINYSKAVIVAQAEDVLKNKPEGDYYKADKTEYREYIPTEAVEDIYFGAKLGSMTLLELTSLKELTQEEQLAFFETYFSEFNSDSEKFYDHLDELFEFALNKFKERTGPLKEHREFKKLENSTDFSSKNDLKKFLQEASNLGENRIKTTIHCTILKYMYLYNELKKKPLFNLVEQIENGTINTSEMIRDIYSLDEKTKIKRNNKNIYTFKKEIADVPVTITFRVKGVGSIVKKALAKGEYMDIDNFFDIFGATVYVPKKYTKDLSAVMMEIDRIFYDGKAYVKNKNFLKQKHLEGLSENDTVERKYLKALGTDKKNKASSEKYKDCKLIGKGVLENREDRESINQDITVGFETKFLFGKPEEDANDTGMSFHPIYEHFGKYFEGEKNRDPFIVASCLENHIYNLYDKLVNDDFLEKYNKKKLEIFEEIHEELIEKPMQKITSNRQLKKLYYNTLAPAIFTYLHKKYDFRVSTLKGRAVLTTEENRDQIAHTGRGYDYVV